MIKNSISSTEESKRKRDDTVEEKGSIKVRATHHPLYKNIHETQKEVEEADGKLRNMDITDD